MSSPQFPYPAPEPPTQRSSMMTALAAGAIVACLAGNGYLLYQVHDMNLEAARSREIVQSEIDTLKENNTVMTATSRKHMDDLKADLDDRSKQLSQQATQQASQAKREALSYADQQTQKVQAESHAEIAKTAESVSKVNADLSSVKQTAETATARLNDVGADVNGVKTDLAGTKDDLAKTKSDLKKVTGDLGLTSGLVATNGKEIEELRRRGERNIIEFHVNRQKDFTKVGDVSLLLKKTDPKKNKFTVELRADDKLMEKKDRNPNEPMQFYVSKSLYEIVVNNVGKDTISGYLSTPKYQTRNN